MDGLMDIAVQEDDIKSVAATLFGGKILFPFLCDLRLNIYSRETSRC